MTRNGGSALLLGLRLLGLQDRVPVAARGGAQGGLRVDAGLLGGERERQQALTGVGGVLAGCGHGQARLAGPGAELGGERERGLAEGDFPAGSMGPKMESAARFVEESAGGRALVTDAASLVAAVNGEGGTWIIPDDAAVTA